jgi:hypothetical protein
MLDQNGVGLVYLLNQTGIALMQANQHIIELTAELEKLRAELRLTQVQQSENT